MGWRSFKFSRNPILWVGFGVILLQFINNMLQHRPLDASLVSSLIGAAGAVIGRSLVTPVLKETKVKNAKSLDAGF
jgi:hypothetical protein